jgi:Protein of unknown function, DUF417
MKIAAFVADRNIPFLVCSIGMIVMLLWPGKFKMTAPGAEGIIPLVTNSPLISWQFKVFGPYIGSDMIGATEWTAAILLIIGYFKPKAGILGAIILVEIRAEYFYRDRKPFSRRDTASSRDRGDQPNQHDKFERPYPDNKRLGNSRSLVVIVFPTHEDPGKKR